MSEGKVNVSVEFPTKKPTIDDVVGLAHSFLEEIDDSINGEYLYNAMGVKPNKTFLLEGEPGTGKTYSMDALNNSYNYEVYKKVIQPQRTLYSKMSKEDQEKAGRPNPFKHMKLLRFDYSIAEHGTAYINRGSMKMNNFFKKTFFFANQGRPVIVFMDEFESISKKRGSAVNHSEDDKIVNTLNKNLQKVKDTDHMFFVGATNYRSIIDEATLRAGRFDKKYTFKTPTFEERVVGYEKVIEQVNERAGYMVVRGFDIKELAGESVNFNYADISEVVEKAIKSRVRELLHERKDKLIPASYVTQKRLIEAVKKHKNTFKNDEKKIGFNQ